MTIENHSIALDLPLSWVRTTNESFKKNSFQFKTTKLNWVSLAEVPYKKHFQQILDELQGSSPKGLLIRGCTAEIAKQLEAKQFDIMPVGQEAILSLNQKLDSKKSLKKLINRGRRNGFCQQINLTNENKKKLDLFKRESRHGRKPQLKHLFIDNFTQNTKCFVWKNNTGEWQAAITISKVNDQKAQTELLLLKKNAPYGTMEALIFEVFEFLKLEGYSNWSLGEVPFILPENKNKHSKSYWFAWLGKKLVFAYDAQSLYNFKNKFSPKWHPVYLCGFPKISLLSLLELSFRSNYLRLVWASFYTGL